MGRSPDSASPGPPGDQGLPGLDGIRGNKTKNTNFYNVKKTPVTSRNNRVTVCETMYRSA